MSSSKSGHLPGIRGEVFLCSILVVAARASTAAAMESFRSGTGGNSNWCRSTSFSRHYRKKSADPETVLQLRPQQANHVVRRNHPRQLPVFVDYGQREQVVLIKLFGHFFLGHSSTSGNQGLLRQ